MFKRYPVLFFYLFSLAVSWTLWIPAIPSLQGLMTLEVPAWSLVSLLLGAAGPTIAAMIITYSIKGRPGLTSLARDFVRWRVPARWYLAVIGLPLIAFGFSIPLVAGYTGAAPTLDARAAFAALPTLALAYVVRFLFALPTGPLLEEAGWRGFALPNLQRHYGALWAGALVGVMWGLWHLPLFWVPGASLPGGVSVLEDPLSVVWYVAGTVGKSILITWVYNNTRGSLLLDILFHAAINTTSNVFLPIFYPDPTPEIIAAVGFAELGLTWATVAVVTSIFGRRRLSKDKVDWMRRHQVEP